MRRILDRYHEDSKNKELEVRIILRNYDDWAKMYAHCAREYDATYALEQSLNTISMIGREQYRRELIFVNGAKKEERSLQKTKLMDYNISIGNIEVRISLAEEIPIASFSSYDAHLMRFRLRASFIPHDLVGWRVDFTLVWSLNKTQFTNVAKIKSQIFPTIPSVKSIESLTSKKYLEFIDTLAPAVNPQISWELELEYIGKPVDIDETQLRSDIEHFIYTLEPSARNILREVMQLFSAEVRRKTLKQFASKPKSFTYNEWQDEILPHISEYYLSDKADGERALLYIESEQFIIYAEKTEPIELKKIPWKKPTILDVEVIIKSTAVPLMKLYLFDVLMLDGENLTNEIFSVRESKLSAIASALAPAVEKKIQIPLDQKKYAEQIRATYERESRMYPIDGLIFTQNVSYFYMNVYKWKPPEKSSIDFLIMKCPRTILGVEPYLPREGSELHFLLCGITFKKFRFLRLEYFPGYRELFAELGLSLRENYFPIQFSPASHPLAYLWYAPIAIAQSTELNAHIGEFVYKSDAWQLIKMRPDRDVGVQEGTGFGNDFVVAEKTFAQFFHPLTLDMLTQVSGGADYFAQKKLYQYDQITRFNSFVKAQLIRQLENTNFVVDLASGKGQDLFRYVNYHIKQLLFMDRDAAALEELNRRRHQIRPTGEMPQIYVKEIDLTTDHKKIMKSLSDAPHSEADGVVMNFAIHYIIKDENALQNLIALVDSLLRPGGIFIFTCFDGMRVFDKLRNIDQQKTWDLRRNEVLKYSIKKLFLSNVLTNFGQEIGVLLPFSRGEYYVENLVNINVIIAAFENAGFEIRQNGSFIEWLDKYMVAQPENKLDEQDKIYASLYQYVTLWKKITKLKV